MSPRRRGIGMDTCRLRTTGTPSERAATVASHESTELCVWTSATPRVRTRRRSASSARGSTAPRMATATTGNSAAAASVNRGLPGWAAMSADQPWSRSQRVSVRIRISWPPSPPEASVWRIRGRRGVDTRVRVYGMVWHLIENFTYLGIFLALFAASLGVPIPEEGPIVAAGVLAHENVVRWWVALPVCLVGVLSGDILLYWVGHHWGERILEWRVVRRVLSKSREEYLKAAYHRHGVKIVFTARHVVGLRAAAFLTAGIAHIPFGKFLFVDTLAALVGVPVSFGIAFVFADQVESVLADVHRIERWIVLYALLAVAAWLAWFAWRQSRRAG